MLYKELGISGYKFYKNASARGYVSRSTIDEIKVTPYKGIYGVGYIAHLPNYNSTSYYTKQYWIKEV